MLPVLTMGGYYDIARQEETGKVARAGTRTVMSAQSIGRIWFESGIGSLSGQYMTQGVRGSLEMLRTRPPTLRARPEGVRGGYWGGGALAGIWAWAAASALDAACMGKRGPVVGGAEMGGEWGALWVLLKRVAKRGDG